jgi:8-oxo-dGTP pyrophosphatase MutT (NUDIX family)
MSGIKPWRELESRQIADCRIFSVESSCAESPVDGSQHEYFRIRSVDWVQVVPVTAAGEIVMVRQYRHGSQAVSLEVPAGLIEPGEPPLQAAIRECREETGYRIANLRPLGVLRPNPALFSNRLHTFCALDAQRVGAIEHTATEITEVELVPIARLRELLMSGRVDHALPAAVLWRFLCEYRDGLGAAAENERGK